MPTVTSPLFCTFWDQEIPSLEINWENSAKLLGFFLVIEKDEVEPGRGQNPKPGFSRRKGCSLSILGHVPVAARVPKHTPSSWTKPAPLGSRWEQERS